MKLVCILWLCLVVNSTYGQRIEEFNPAFATWTDFQTRHIVSSDQGNAANWNTYFRLHIPSQYGNKSVNTFIVNAVSSIAKNFPSGVPQYTGGSASNLYWSSTKQHIFVLILSGPPGQKNPNYKVYDCGQKYYVAGIDMTTRLPVHYQGHSTTQGPKTDKITAGCLVVTKQDLSYQFVIVSGLLIGLVMAALVAVVVFKKYVSHGATGSATNEYSPLISNDDGNQDISVN